VATPVFAGGVGIHEIPLKNADRSAVSRIRGANGKGLEIVPNSVRNSVIGD